MAANQGGEREKRNGFVIVCGNGSAALMPMHKT